MLPNPSRALITRTRSALVRGTVTVAVLAEESMRRVVEGAVRRGRDRGDRGDVPGWVLVTLMTAGLVTVLWVLARDRLTQVFDKAINSVVAP